MIVVNATIESTAQNIDALKQAIADMEVASRAESGCHDYTFSVELNNPNILRITEKWSSMADLNAHFGMPHMADFQAAMAANPPKNVEAKFYEVTEVPPPGA
ncbi:MAG: antibiotic biosynthesis monooxygenase [Gammaproteobacteria bacterium]|jgi:quinol monooxygenase YgiN|nr:antibiotic biosynthesis monooxygenase [Gammaproteobacteria bacterium]MCH1550792.1 antibiotic biosynthesis monooxygenase [Pseudomonadales bacterium]